MGEETELKPCPFCNHNDVRRYAGHGGPKAKCMGCGASGVPVEIWNTRPAPAVEVNPLSVDDLATLMLEEWKRADPRSNVAQHPVSYVATFADMARAVLSALSPQPPLSPREGWDEVKPVLEQAKEALRRSYDICDYPADGDTDQDRAIAAIDALLSKLEKDKLK